ncbi:hypothetical protein OPQ81_003257 [Rhizoctonia solani]|nr:hypothetical protein OPQ81_003257 [Rhizoctonia solani]
MDASRTPGYGDYQRRFVKVVRSVESQFGVPCPGLNPGNVLSNQPSSGDDEDDVVVKRVLEKSASMMKSTPGKPGLNPPHPSSGIETPITYGDDEISAIRSGHGAGRLPLPMSGPKPFFAKRSDQDGHISHGFGLERHNTHRRHHRKRAIPDTTGRIADRTCLMTSFMNKDWQYNNPPNPADAANGPQLYDAHLYFSFGGVADPNAESYMRTICNTDRVRNAYSEGNNPLVFGEWSLATNFDDTDEFLYDWADAQRHIYAGQADGWIFWALKVEESSPYVRHWSYLAALKAGYFKNDPSQLTNPSVCNGWMANKNSTSA